MLKLVKFYNKSKYAIFVKELSLTELSCSKLWLCLQAFFFLFFFTPATLYIYKFYPLVSVLQATAEQIRLAQMIYDKNDADFEDKVNQVRNTHCNTIVCIKMDAFCHCYIVAVVLGSLDVSKCQTFLSTTETQYKLSTC